MTAGIRGQGLGFSFVLEKIQHAFLSEERIVAENSPLLH
jgi:hypothetical protein